MKTESTSNEPRVEYSKGLGVHHHAAFIGEMYIGTYYTECEARAAIERLQAVQAEGMRIFHAGGDSRLLFPNGGGKLYGVAGNRSVLIS